MSPSPTGVIETQSRSENIKESHGGFSIRVSFSKLRRKRKDRKAALGTFTLCLNTHTSPNLDPAPETFSFVMKDVKRVIGKI